MTGYPMRSAMARASSTVDRHARFGHGNVELLHHGAEKIAVLSHVDGLGGGAQDVDPRFFQIRGQIEGGLPAELGDDAQAASLSRGWLSTSSRVSGSK